MKTLILLIDALGYSSINSKNTPNLFNVFKEGFFKPVTTLLGYSNAIIPSIFSGKYPSQHNIWGLYRKSPSTSPFKIYNLFPSSIFDRNLLLRYFANTIIYNDSKKHGLVPSYTTPANIPIRLLKYFDMSMKKHIIEPDSMNGTLTLFDLLRQNSIGFEYIGYPWSKGTEQIFASVENHIHKSSVITAYIDEIDHAGHKYGLHSNDFIKQLRMFDELCASFLRKILDTEKNLAVTIFSDHGMKDVDGTLDLKAAIDLAGLKIEKDYLLFLDSTIARFWTFNKNAHERLSTVLASTKGGRLLREDEIKKYKINFKSDIYGDLQYLTDTGKLILPNFYTILGGTVKAMHGWDPDDKTQDSFLFTNHIPQNTEIEDVSKIFDVIRESIKIK